MKRGRNGIRVWVVQCKRVTVASEFCIEELKHSLLAQRKPRFECTRGACGCRGWKLTST